MADLRAEIGGILLSTEGTIMCLKQSRLSALAPTFIILTDANVITVHFSFWHYYAGFRLWGFTRSTYKCIIPYRNIIAATLIKGNFFSTLELKTKDIEHTEKRNLKDTVVIDGLFTENAERLVKIINLLIIAHQFPPQINDLEKVSLKTAVESCKEKGSMIVWLGFEDKKSVASALSIPANLIEPITLPEFFDMPVDKLKNFQNCMLLGYTVNSANVIGKVLYLEAQLSCTVIDGGLVNNMPKETILIRSNMLARRRDERMIPLANGRDRQKYIYTDSKYKT